MTASNFNTETTSGNTEFIKAISSVSKEQLLAWGIKNALKIVMPKGEDYGPEDLEVLDAARRAYRKSFNTETFPVHLQYRNEYLKNHAPDNSKITQDNKENWPPFPLPFEYDISHYSFGDNAVAPICKAEAKSLMKYLNVRNKRWTVNNKLGRFEGHKSDSVAQLVNLIIHAFQIFSHIDLKSGEDKVRQVKNYIEFILQLRHIKAGGKLLQGFRGTVTGKDDGETFEQRIVDAELALEEVQQSIERALYSCSTQILFENLSTRVENFLPAGFDLALQILASKPIDMEISMRSVSNANTQEKGKEVKSENKKYQLSDETSALNRMMAKFALSVQEKISGKKSSALHFKYIPLLKEWYSDEDLFQEKSGIYQAFQNKPAVVKTLKKYVALLEQMAFLLYPIRSCINVAQFGGEIICLKEQNDKLYETVLMVEATLKELNVSWDELWSYALEHDRELSRRLDGKRTSQDKEWKEGFSRLIRSSLTKNYFDEVRKLQEVYRSIKDRLQDWKFKPKSELNDKLEQEIKALDESTQMQSTYLKLCGVMYSSVLPEKVAVAENKIQPRAVPLLPKAPEFEVPQTTISQPEPICFQQNDWDFVESNFESKPEKEIFNGYVQSKQRFQEEKNPEQVLALMKIMEDSLIKLDAFVKNKIGKSKKSVEQLYFIRSSLVHEHVTLYELLYKKNIGVKLEKTQLAKLESSFVKKTSKMHKADSSKSSYKYQVVLAQARLEKIKAIFNTPYQELEKKEEVKEESKAVVAVKTAESAGSTTTKVEKLLAQSIQLSKEVVKDLIVRADYASRATKEKPEQREALPMSFHDLDKIIMAQENNLQAQKVWCRFAFPQIKKNLSESGIESEELVSTIGATP